MGKMTFLLAQNLNWPLNVKTVTKIHLYKNTIPAHFIEIPPPSEYVCNKKELKGVERRK